MKQDEIIEEYALNKFDVKKEGNLIVYQIHINDVENICKNLYFEKKLQLKMITATDERKQNGVFKIYYIFGLPKKNIFLVPFIILNDIEQFPSITKYIHEASGYERRIKSFFGLEPVGHPNPRQILLHENWPDKIFPLRKDFSLETRPKDAHGSYKFQKVKGEGIYEIPVGPVHAGIIEPGHFRFNMAGEEIVLLEPKLGYKHKGIEKLFETLPIEEKIRLSERVSGDSSFSHSLAFCQALEELSSIQISERVKYLRVIFSEFERLANHFNDIGFIMLDTGYNFGGSNGSRLREIIMQWNEHLSGNRFLRDINTIGGVLHDISERDLLNFSNMLEDLLKDFEEVIEISENSSSLFNRLSKTGKMNYEIAKDHGVLGVAGRAVGIIHDARIEYPYAAYDKMNFEISLEKEGDVKARWYVRIKEVRSSISILKQAILSIPRGELKSEKKIIFRKNSLSIGVTEGWRGEIIYLIITDDYGQINRVDVRDPSFINWSVLGHVGKGNIIPDFPLINKSFNLSYSGNDL